MRTIIYDLEDTSYLKFKDNDVLLNDINKSCIGCFSCWVRTPLHCIHKDKISNNGENLLKCDDLIIISKFTYGSYSSSIKKILERSISYVEPFFTLRNGEIHHKTRTNKKLNFSIYFYGPNISDEYKIVATKLVNANMNNLNTNKPNIYFYNDYKEIKI